MQAFVGDKMQVVNGSTSTNGAYLVQSVVKILDSIKQRVKLLKGGMRCNDGTSIIITMQKRN